jgi:O-antigen/teichoic acid export membrane protein
MFSFGSKILVFSLIEIIFNNIYQTFIGKIYSASELGYYTRAVTFQTVATQATSTSISRVIFPTLTPYQNDDNKLKLVFKKTFRMASFIHFPMMIGLFLIADPLFRILLTDKWAASIPYFQILCLVGLLYPQRLLNLNIINIKGKSSVNLYLLIFEKILIILAILLTFHGGVISLLYGQLITTIIFYILSSYYSGRLISYSLIERLKDLISIIIISLLMGIVTFFIGEFFIFGNILNLIFQIILGIIFYLLISKMFKSPELGEYQKIVFSLLNHYWKLFKIKQKKNISE